MSTGTETLDPAKEAGGTAVASSGLRRSSIGGFQTGVTGETSARTGAIKVFEFPAATEMEEVIDTFVCRLEEFDDDIARVKLVRSNGGGKPQVEKRDFDWGFLESLGLSKSEGAVFVLTILKRRGEVVYRARGVPANR
jgi:hypothetical protein